MNITEQVAEILKPLTEGYTIKRREPTATDPRSVVVIESSLPQEYVHRLVIAWANGKVNVTMQHRSWLNFEDDPAWKPHVKSDDLADFPGMLVIMNVTNRHFAQYKRRKP